jgi:hypothetical protein
MVIRTNPRSRQRTAHSFSGSAGPRRFRLLLARKVQSKVSNVFWLWRQWIERDRGQFVSSRRRRMMANVRAERLLKIPSEPSPELRIPNAAAQTRIVSKARIRLDSRKSVRSFKGIICDYISEIAVDTVITVNGSF